MTSTGFLIDESLATDCVSAGSSQVLTSLRFCCACRLSPVGPSSCCRRPSRIALGALEATLDQQRVLCGCRLPSSISEVTSGRLRLRSVLSRLLGTWKFQGFFTFDFLSCSSRCGQSIIDDLKPAGSGVISPMKLWDRPVQTKCSGEQEALSAGHWKCIDPTLDLWVGVFVWCFQTLDE